MSGVRVPHGPPQPTCAAFPYNREVPPRLIVNADDFGQTPGINLAVEELYRAGALTSATLMAGGSAFESAVEIARRNPRLGVGCHVVLVDGTPIAPADSVPSLLGPDGKTFRSSIADFAVAALRGGIRPEDVEREAIAQMQRLQHAGIQITHLDTHKHTHLFPAVLAPLLRAAKSAGVHSLRRPFEPRWSATLAGEPLLRRLQLKALGQFAPSFDQLILGAPDTVRVPAGTLGIAATGTLNAQRLRAILNALPQSGTFELCCHPGHVDAALVAQKTRLRATRETEFCALLEVIPEILRTQVPPQLIHYGQI
jgi:predicted glycoside hydrolase/deacetylase ChbG (UPF0249 family)